MMRTENELREAIGALADEAPDVSSILDRRSPNSAEIATRSPRRLLAPLIAAAVVLVLAVGVGFAFHVNSTRSNQNSGSAPYMPLEWKFSVGEVPGYTISRMNISRPSLPAADVSEQASVTATGKGKTTGLIELDTVPGKIVTTSDVTTVAGVTYYFRAGHHVSRQGGLTPAQYADPWTAASQDAYGPQLSWSYPDGSQVIVSGTFGFLPKKYNYDNASARKTLMKIALVIRPGQHEPVTMPFRIQSLPSGLVPVGLRITPPESAGSRGTLGNQSQLSACLQYATPDQPSPQDATESVLLACRTRVGTSQSEALAAAGFTKGFVENYAVRKLPDGTVLAVGFDAGQRQHFSKAQLESIAQKADVSPDLTRTKTWQEVAR